MVTTLDENNNNNKNKIWTRDFIFICLANFFIFLGFQMTLPTLPLFVEELGGNEQMIGFVVGIFTLSSLFTRPYAGHALDIRGRKFIYVTGLAIFVVSVGSYAFATTMLFLFLMRVVQGVGWGLSTTASGTIATDIIPVKRLGEGMGYFGLAGNLALALGPSLGLFLVLIIPFNQLFLICATFGAIALLLSLMIRYKKVDRTAPKKVNKKIDLVERSALPPSILILFNTVTFGGIASFLPLYTAEKNISGIQWYFLIYAASLLLSRTFSGRIYDHKGHIAVFPPGVIAIIVGMLLLTWLPNKWILFMAAFIYGLGFGSVQPALQAWAVNKAPQHRKGMANATFYSFFDLGIGLGAVTFGQIAFLFGYKSIYLSSAISVSISLILYIIFLRRDVN